MIYFDDLKRSVELPKKVHRIISLVPSLTELLFDLGLKDKLIARTQFCIHPKEYVALLPSVGGTKDFDLEKIRELQPDLVIAVKEENNKNLVLKISKEFPVLVYDIVDMASAIRVIKHIGGVTDTQGVAVSLVNKIQQKIYKAQKQYRIKRSTCYLIWNNPMMTVGDSTFISDMMNLAGFVNTMDSISSNYFVITPKELERLKPEYILLSSEPFRFTEKHRIEYQKRYPYSKIRLVDGEMFSWYGSRILKAFDYFQSQFN